jgi:hypothetical protein
MATNRATNFAELSADKTVTGIADPPPIRAIRTSSSSGIPNLVRANKRGYVQRPGPMLPNKSRSKKWN